jgi:hypothetical protein
MTPSNNPNGEPLIYRICDAAGVFHLVAPVNHTHTYADIPGLADELSELWAGVNEKAGQEEMEEALAAKQDALTFDTTPTANSTNPVTSGGIKAAIADATKGIFTDSLPFSITTAHEKMHVYTAILKNKTGAAMRLDQCIDVSSLPAEERGNVLWNEDGSASVDNTEEVAIRFMRADDSIYIWYDGKFVY